MIVVLADDLSGAAELGGLAFLRGLDAEIQTRFDPDTDADLIVVDMGSRSLPAGEAYARVAEIARQCSTFKLYKKVDSVLRGNVLAELAALLDSTGRRRVLLVAANPGLGRTIEQGHYLVDGKPLHKTDFAKDPEHPATVSGVMQLLLQADSLGIADRWPVHVMPADGELPECGVIVGEAERTSDLQSWAESLVRDIIPSGAAEFFGAYLSVCGYPAIEESSVPPAFDGATLIVSGSRSASAHRYCLECQQAGIPVFRLPLELLHSAQQVDDLIQELTSSAIQAFEQHRQVIVAIDRPLCKESGAPRLPVNYLAAIVEVILQACPISHIMVEGGATVAALVNKLEWQRMRVWHAFAPGVVGLQLSGTDGPLLTVKPGSYVWPLAMTYT